MKNDMLLALPAGGTEGGESVGTGCLPLRSLELSCRLQEVVWIIQESAQSDFLFYIHSDAQPPTPTPSPVLTPLNTALFLQSVIKRDGDLMLSDELEEDYRFLHDKSESGLALVCKRWICFVA